MTAVAACRSTAATRRSWPGAADGAGGVLTVKSLTIDGVAKPAGEYTAATERWIEGKGKVVVRP